MNPVAKRTFTGIFVGRMVICAVLFAPPVVIAPVVGVLAVLALAEYFSLLGKKGVERSFLSVLGAVVGAAVIV